MNRYTLTVPLADNDGHDLAELHRFIRLTGLGPFGCWTELSGLGAWRNGGLEGVTVYCIDTDRPDAFVILRALALVIKRSARQDAVYLTCQPIDTYLI